MGRDADARGVAIASRRPRFCSSNVWILRSSVSASVDGPGAPNGEAAMLPSAPTAMPLLAKNALPRVLVWAGPTKTLEHEDRVVRHRSVELLERREARRTVGEHELVAAEAADRGDPFAGRHARRARPRVCSASRIELAFSSRVSCPGRRPSRMMWLWLSMMPGTAVRPRRSTVRVQRSSSRPPPTSTNRPSRISTDDTTVSFLSIVWIRPLTSLSERCPAQSRSSLAAAGIATNAPASKAIPAPSTRRPTPRTSKCLIDRSF